MTSSTSLSRLRLAGKLCRRGAWIIAVMGLAIVIFMVIITVTSYQTNSGQNFNDLLTSSAITLLVAITIFFFFLVLLAIGALLDYLSTEQNSQEVNDERVEITSLPEMR